MNQSNYQYLIASLPELTLPDLYSPPGEMQDYRRLGYLFSEIMENLSEKDHALARYIFYSIDNRNLVNLLFHPDEPFVPHGYYNQAELDYESKALDAIPEYMKLFLELVERGEPEVPNLRIEDHLYDYFYRETSSLQSPFLREWYSFERDLHNILSAIECRKHNVPIEHRKTIRIGQELAQAIIGDNEISHAIVESRSYDFSLSGTLPLVERVLTWDSSNPIVYKREIVQLKWEVLGELSAGEIFSLESVLAYLARLQLLIRWSSLDEASGRENADRILRKLLKQGIALSGLESDRGAA